jgi:cytochrome oxidase Cu insertion factor (SCO1/SenC/PrrC family)
VPVLAQAKAEMKGKNVKFVSLSSDSIDGGADIAAWYKKHGAKQPVWAGKIDHAGANRLHTSYKLEFETIPSTFVVDADGVILGHFDVIHDAAALTDLIGGALE